MTKLISRSFLAAAALVACGTESQPAQVPDGLHVDKRDATGVRGTFAQNGVAVAFELATDGAVHRVRIADLDGHPLVDRTVDESTDASTLFDGAQLAGLPEADVLAPLGEALHVRGGIAEPVLAATTKATAAGGWPNWYGCNNWIQPGDGVICGSTFFGYTSINVENYWSPSINYFHYWSEGFAAPYPGEMGTFDAVGGYSSLSLGGWWWGQWVYVYNDGPNWIYVTH